MKKTTKVLTLGALLIVSLMRCGCRSPISPPPGVEPVTRVMTVTGYCPCGKCCNWRRNWLGRPVHASGPMAGKPKQVGLTASGVRARRGTIAADTKRYPFGTIMFVEGYGYGRVEDRGGAVKGEHIDLFFHHHRQALEWGRQTKTVKIWIDPRNKR